MMEEQALKNKIFRIVSQVMDVPIDNLKEDSSPDTVDKWDSIQHMNLVIALEEGFDIEFSDNEIIELLSIELIYEVISAKK